MRALLLSLSLLLAAARSPADAQQAPLPGITEGVEYRLIDGGQRYRPQAGKIEVAEVFAYWCHHCARFDPMLDAWKRSLPASARFIALPLVSGPDDAYGRVFFAAEASKSLPALHPHLFRAIHETNQLPKAPRLEQVTAFAAKVPGVHVGPFKAALADDAALRAKLAHAKQFAQRSDIPGTPSLVIDGRYLVLGNSFESLLGNARKIVAALAPAAPPKSKQPAAKAAAPKPRPDHGSPHALAPRSADACPAALGPCKPDTPAPVALGPSLPHTRRPAGSAEDPAAQAAAEAAVQAAAAAAAQAPPPVAGTDYVELPGGQPFDTTDGRIEVVEFFGYVCPFCAAVQPTVRAMKAKLPADVRMIYVPAAFGSMWDTYAKAYYTAEAMGVVDQSHDAMYRAIHIDKTLKGERGWTPRNSLLPSMPTTAPIRSNSSAAWRASPWPPRSTGASST